MVVGISNIDIYFANRNSIFCFSFKEKEIYGDYYIITPYSDIKLRIS